MGINGSGAKRMTLLSPRRCTGSTQRACNQVCSLKGFDLAKVDLLLAQGLRRPLLNGAVRAFPAPMFIESTEWACFMLLFKNPIAHEEGGALFLHLSQVTNDRVRAF